MTTLKPSKELSRKLRLAPEQALVRVKSPQNLDCYINIYANPFFFLKAFT
jgi:hypothetical protein